MKKITALGEALLSDLRTLRRVEEIFARYCRDGKRPTRAEAEAWLRSEGWNEYPLANLLRQWGYDDAAKT